MLGLDKNNRDQKARFLPQVLSGCTGYGGGGLGEFMTSWGGEGGVGKVGGR